MPLPRRSLCGLLLTLLAPALACGQDAAPAGGVVLPGENLQARNRLRAIDQLIVPLVSPRAAAGWLGRLQLSPLEGTLALGPVVAERPLEVWEQAEEAYYYLLAGDGTALVPLPSDGLAAARTSVQLRRLCHRRIAGLPTAVRYRQRVDAEARRLLELGRSRRDPAPLRQLVDEMFCATGADEALDLLGDLAFERGDFDEARHWWRRLAPLPPPDAADGPEPLRYPDPRVDGVRVEAKQILALAFAGRLAEAQDQLDRFHRRHPDARGPLAGKVGPYSAAVQEAIRGVVQAGITSNADPWPTFAGSPGRNHALTVCPPARLWEDGPSWQVALPPVDGPKKPHARDDVLPPGRDGPRRRCAFHPVIAGEQVLIADARSVWSYHLTSGKPLFRYDLKADHGGAEPRCRLPRFTLTVEGDRAYARLGRQTLAPRSAGEADAPSYLVCLNLSEPADAQRPRETWRVAAQGEEGEAVFFEGAPLARAGHVYVAQSRVPAQGKRVVTAVQCYDRLGRLRWSRDVCEVPEFADDAAPRDRQHLLTWAGGQLVYGSHSGAIVAVDPWTGQTVWAVRYPSHRPHGSARSPRDLAPCVYDDGRVYAAPLDSDRLFCLEACTGRVLWEREGLEIVHLLGVCRGRVVVTTRQGLHALAAGTGLTLWQEPSAGTLAPLGRGLIAGGWVFWPTQDGQLPLRAVTLNEGTQQKGEGDNGPFAEPAAFDPTQLRHIPAGNLALGGGCLVVAGPEMLTVFVPAGQMLPGPPPPDHRPYVQGLGFRPSRAAG